MGEPDGGEEQRRSAMEGFRTSVITMGSDSQGSCMFLASFNLHLTDERRTSWSNQLVTRVRRPGFVRSCRLFVFVRKISQRATPFS